MLLITEIKATGFRSLKDTRIEGLSSFTALAGLNNTGKTSILLALNCFFNDRTNDDHGIDFQVDLHRSDKKSKKRKSIRIEVGFSLPDNFRFRKDLEPVSDFLGNRTFTIAKEWTSSAPAPHVFLNGNELEPDGEQRVKQFLSLIKYRYIPNRLPPTELLRQERDALRQALIRRFSRRTPDTDSAFETIAKTARSLIEPLAQQLESALPDEGRVRLATPSSWQDILFPLGYSLERNGIEIEDLLQGSGVQSSLLIETLYLIDRDYFQKFGWRQAAVWGLEEPETSLHTSLEASVANRLRAIAADDDGRLQVIVTTHSDIFVQNADRTVILKTRQGRTVTDTVDDPREALDRLSTLGISRWIHPLLYYPLDPVILVEGPSDREFLSRAFSLLGFDKSLRIVDLQRLDPTAKSGGVEHIEKYIRANAEVVRHRREDAPLVVVLDWDARKKRRKLHDLGKGATAYHVVAWPDEALNPKIGKSFKGIERAYSDRIIEEGIRRGAPIEQTTSGRFVVEEREHYDRVKSILRDVVKQELRIEDIEIAKPFLEKILDIVRQK